MDQGLLARQITVRALMNTNMVERSPVREHVLKIFDHLNALVILGGGKIDCESQIDIILESLSNSFNQFKINCNMNKINFILFELLNTLQVARVLSRSRLVIIM